MSTANTAAQMSVISKAQVQTAFSNAAQTAFSSTIAGAFASAIAVLAEFLKPSITEISRSRGPYYFQVLNQPEERIVEINDWFENERTKYSRAMATTPDGTTVYFPSFRKIEQGVYLVSFDRRRHKKFATLFKLFWLD